jgi:hypothetical protein
MGEQKPNRTPPMKIVRTARRVIYRIMSYNGWLKDLFAAWEHLRWLCVT